MTKNTFSLGLVVITSVLFSSSSAFAGFCYPGCKWGPSWCKFCAYNPEMPDGEPPREMSTDTIRQTEEERDALDSRRVELEKLESSGQANDLQKKELGAIVHQQQDYDSAIESAKEALEAAEKQERQKSKKMNTSKQSSTSVGAQGTSRPRFNR